MPRLIDADVLVATFDRLADDPWNADANTTWSKAYTYAVELINEQDSAVEFEKPINKVLVFGVEYIPVVRCQDCKWWDTEYIVKPNVGGYCHKVCGTREADFYCADGKKEEE